MSLTAYVVPLAQVTSFKYLGRVLAADYNGPAVVRSLRRARQEWAQLTRILSREGVYSQALGQIYLVIVQSIMLYGLDTWVLTPPMKRVLGGLYHRVSRRLTGRKTHIGRDGGWFYTPLEDAMAGAVLY